MSLIDRRQDHLAHASVSPAPTSSLVVELQRLIDEPSLHGRDPAGLSEEVSTLLSCCLPDDQQATAAGHNTDNRPTAISFPLSIGRFQVLSLLGSGGFGIVFRAFDPKLDRQVALKILRPEAAVSASIRRRFLREAKAAAQLEHPGIISVYDAGSYSGLSYLAAPWCDGPNLATWLSEHPRELTPRQSALLIAQVAEAVQHAHLRGILHRDLKPSNILLKSLETASGELPFEPLLTDFGLARRLDGDEEETCQGMVLGTKAYMSPEQAAGRWNDVGVGSDVFSLGVILYELLTGVRPSPAWRSGLDVRPTTACPPPPLSLRRICPAISRDLETICLKALAEQPSQRYTTAGDFAADLRRTLAHQPIQARSSSFSKQVWLAFRRRPVVASLLFLLAITLMSSAVVTGFLYQRERAQRALAEEHLDFAREAVSKMYTKVADKWLVNQPEVQGLRREFLEDALRFYERIAAQQPHDERSRHELSVALHRMANISSQLGRHAQAVQFREQCREIVDALVQEHRENEAYQYDAFMNRLLLGPEYGSVGHAERTIPTLLEAEVMIRRLLNSSPENAIYRDALAALCNDIAWRVEAKDGEPKWLEAAALSEKLLEEDPKHLLYGKHGAVANVRLALLRRQQGKLDEAQQHFTKAKAIADLARQELPDERWTDELTFDVEASYAYQILKEGDAAAALPLLKDSQAAQDRLCDCYTASPGYRISRSDVLIRLADAYGQLDRTADARAALESAKADLVFVRGQNLEDKHSQKMHQAVIERLKALPRPNNK